MVFAPEDNHPAFRQTSSRRRKTTLGFELNSGGFSEHFGCELVDTLPQP